jgi:hypothetical protein
MTRTSSLCCIALGLGLFGYAWASSGVGEEAASSVDVQAPTTSLKVAEIAYSDKRLVEIYETGDGGFSYVQSGPIDTYPMLLPDDPAEPDDPIRVFQTLAPDQAIPGVLRRAVKRAEAVRAMAPSAEDSRADDQEDLSGRASDQAPIGAVASQTTQEGGTLQAGCPEWWFNQARIGSHLFCPYDENAYCAKWVNWAFLYNRRGWNSYGVVCTDSGEAIFQTTLGFVVDTYRVPAGTWRYVVYPGRRSCGWFSCNDVRGFRRFELVNGPAVAHFGARID